MAAFWLILACNGSGTVKPGDPPEPTTPPAPEPTTPPLPTTEPPAPCDPVAGLNVVSAEVSQPWHENEARVVVTLSEPASVAVSCALADDPTEVHLVESSAELVERTLDLSGLLGNRTYDCRAAAVCPSTDAGPLAFSLVTGEVNPLLPPTDVEWTGEAGDEYLLANHSDDCAWRTNRLVVFDRDGRPRWWSETPEFVGPSLEFRYHGDDRFTWGGGWEPNALGRPRQVDLFEGEVYDSGVALPDVNQSAFHHDGKQLADGRLLTLEQVTVREGNGDTFDGFQVRRLDPVTGVVDFTYDSQRAYDEGHLPGGNGDAWHANWMEIATVDGREVLVVSFCFLHALAFVDVATGEWIGTFGAGGDFAVEPSGPLGLTECVHGAEYDGSRLLVYDNGRDRGFSRVAEYTVDLDTLSMVQEWTWTEPDWWETTLGDADWLPSGNVLVGMAHAECFSSNPGDNPTIAEIDPVAGERVWQLRYADRGETFYRADFADACTLFANAKYCPAVADRLAELAPVLP